MVRTIVHDFTVAARGLRRSPAFTVTAILTLTLGIGATTSVFSIVYAVLFRPLPFPNADRLVQVVQVLNPPPNALSVERPRAGLSRNQFVELQAHTTALAAVGRYQVGIPGTLTGIHTPVRLIGARVSPSLFRALGVMPLVGRTFSDEDERAGAYPVAIISHGTWMRYFGGSATVVGQRVALNGTPHRVIGVMPRGVGFPSLAHRFMSRNSIGVLDSAPEFWLPTLPLPPAAGAGAAGTLFPVLALLKNGVRLERAASEVRSIVPPRRQNERLPIELVSAHVEMGRALWHVLMIFQLGVALILLIACVNVVNLLLARAAHRERELAIRVALGAGVSRVIRESMMESLLLAAGGGTTGCVLAYGLTNAIRVLPPHLLPRMQEIRLDGVVLAFALTISVATGLGIGLLSALRVIRRHRSGRFTQQALRGISPSPDRHLRPSGVLVVVEIAAAMVLLAGAGLLINSFVRLIRVDPGFEPHGVLTFSLTLPPDRYATTASQEQFYAALSHSLSGVPTVEALAASNSTLRSPNISFGNLSIDGRLVGEAGITVRQVTPEYFRTLQIPIRGGREFQDADRASVAGRVIVNESFVRRYIGKLDAVGHTLSFSRWPLLEVIGVVADAKEALDVEPRPTFYLPADDVGGFRRMVLYVRASATPLALVSSARAAVRDLDPQLAVYDTVTLEQWIADSAASPRFYGVVSFWSGFIALALASIGLYGLLAYSVSTRSREFGIRLALGGSQRAVIAGVMGQGVVLALTGILIGLTGAYYASRFLRNLLFSVAPQDPITFVVAGATFILVAIAACYIPSRRATRVDPIVALRAD